METSVSGQRSLKRIAEAFFAQIKAVGQLALGNDTSESVLDTGLADRIAFIRSFYHILEEVVDLRFSRQESPFLYNTVDWPEGVAPGGYLSRNHSPRPSQLIPTFLGNWTLEWGDNSATGRILRAALWICHENGLNQALRYLLDLQRAGFILDPHTTFSAISMIAIARDGSESDTEVSRHFFGDKLPVDGPGWIRADFIEFDFGGTNCGHSVGNGLLEQCLATAEDVRDCASYDDWITGQWQLAALMLQWKLFYSELGESSSATLRAIDDQLDEVRCDSGALQRVFRAKRLRDCFRASFPMVGVIPVIKHKSPKDWRQRVLNERVVVPRCLADDLLRDDYVAIHVDRQALEWRGFSPTLAPIFSSVVKGEPFWSCWRLEPFPSVVFLKIPEIQMVFTENDVHDRQEQISTIEHHYLGTMKHLHDLLEGKPGLRLSDNEELPQLLDKAHIELCAREIESTTMEAMDLCERGKGQLAIEALEKLVKMYPWSEIVHSELGIAFDKAEQHEKALSHMETAIIVNPEHANYWQSLGVILRNLDCPEEANIANAIQFMIVQRDESRM